MAKATGPDPKFIEIEARSKQHQRCRFAHPSGIQEESKDDHEDAEYEPIKTPSFHLEGFTPS